MQHIQSLLVHFSRSQDLWTKELSDLFLWGDDDPARRDDPYTREPSHPACDLDLLATEDQVAAYTLEQLDITMPSESLMGCLSLTDDNSMDYTADQRSLCENDSRLQVKIHYVGEAVAIEMVTGKQGCRIHHKDSGHAFVNINDPPMCEVGEHGIALADHSGSSISPVVNKVLTSLGGGVAMRCAAGDIWATRFSRCSIFWKDQTSGEWHKLFRDQNGNNGNFTKIFDWREFERQLHAFRTGGGKQPVYEVVLSLGHRPRTKDNVNHLTVSVTVVHYQAFSALMKLSSKNR